MAALFQKLLQRLKYWRQYLVAGEWELRELRAYVPRDRIALDIGANNGVYSYFLARLAKSVVSFEPNPGYINLLSQVNIPSVTVHRVALSDHDGEAELRIPLEGARGEVPGMASLNLDVVPDQHLARVIKTPLRRLDDYKLDPIGFIKIDVEGHEEQVLKGGLETIRRDQPSLLIEIEERHNVGGLQRINELLSGLGYRAFFFLDGKRHPLSEFDIANHQDPALVAGVFRNRRVIRYVNNFLFLHTSLKAA